MCLIAFAWSCHPQWPLVLVANRDEAHARPTAALGPHPELTGVFGGRDLEKGGSWLLAADDGRLAAVTNVRDGMPDTSRPRSRGALVDGFLRSRQTPREFAEGLAGTAADYGRFNLLLCDGQCMHYAGNHPAFRHFPVAPGLHALSNGAFDAPWPKASRATEALRAWLERGDAPPEALFDALADRSPAEDAFLPDTGVGLARERLLSPAFIVGEAYGTRSSAVILSGPAGLRFGERRFGPGGALLGEDWVRRSRADLS